MQRVASRRVIRRQWEAPSHEVVGRLDFHRRGLFPKARLDSRMMGVGIWRDMAHNVHRERRRITVTVDAGEKEKGTVNAGQTSVTRVGAPYTRMGGDVHGKFRRAV